MLLEYVRVRVCYEYERVQACYVGGVFPAPSEVYARRIMIVYSVVTPEVFPGTVGGVCPTELRLQSGDAWIRSQRDRYGCGACDVVAQKLTAV